MIKGIFFDAAGVFYDRRETTGALARRRLKALGFAVELAPEVEECIKRNHALANEGRLHYEAYWDEYFSLHGVKDAGLRAQLKKQVLDQTFNVFAYPGGRAAMAGLTARGFILGLVTDTIYPVEWKMAWLKQVGIAEFIQVVACSSTLGAHKPQPEMYLNALKQSGLTPQQAAFVGHDAVELEGAHRAGLVTVAVNYDVNAKADYFVDSLPGLLDVPIFQHPELH